MLAVLRQKPRNKKPTSSRRNLRDGLYTRSRSQAKAPDQPPEQKSSPYQQSSCAHPYPALPALWIETKDDGMIAGRYLDTAKKVVRCIDGFLLAIDSCRPARVAGITQHQQSRLFTQRAQHHFVRLVRQNLYFIAARTEQVLRPAFPPQQPSHPDQRSVSRRISRASCGLSAGMTSWTR